jgi:hypothetical protein
LVSGGGQLSATEAADALAVLRIAARAQIAEIKLEIKVCPPKKTQPTPPPGNQPFATTVVGREQARDKCT